MRYFSTFNAQFISDNVGETETFVQFRKDALAVLRVSSDSKYSKDKNQSNGSKVCRSISTLDQLETVEC